MRQNLSSKNHKVQSLWVLKCLVTYLHILAITVRVSLRNPWDAIVPSPVKCWDVPLKRLSKGLNEIYLQKCLMQYLVWNMNSNFLSPFFWYFLVLLCFGEFPQDFFFVLYASILLYHLKIFIYTWHIYTARQHQRLHKCLYHICSLTGRGLILPSDIKYGPKMAV